METSEQSRRVAGVFDRVAGTYDAVGVEWFRPIAQGLVAELAPQPGERALDVGCGRGAALFALADAVGPSGHVTGIDLSSGMIRATQADVDTRGLSNIDLLVADASAPELPSADYDLVCASLVTFFLPDPLVGVRAWHDLLTPGGRLGISTFGPQDPLWVEIDELFSPYLPAQMLDARRSGTTGPFASDAGVEGLLADAGLRHVRTSTTKVTATFQDGEQWYVWSWSHGQRAMWEFIPEDERPAIKAHALELMAGGAGDRGALGLSQVVRYTLGERDPA